MNTMSILLNIDPYWFSHLTDLIAVVVALSIPIVIAVLSYRRRVNETNKRAQVIMAALEKDSGTVPEELINSLNKPKKSLKERLLSKLLWGLVCTILGLGFIIRHYVSPADCGNELGIGGVALIALGVAFLIYYFVGRRTLKKEIEAEEKENNV